MTAYRDTIQLNWLPPGHVPEAGLRINLEIQTQERAGVPPPASLVLLATAAYGGLFLLLHHALSLAWLEDLPVYASALHEFQAGGDPYAVSHRGLHFVYPPLVLLAAAWCARALPLHVERILFTASQLISVLVMPLVLTRYFVRARWWGRYLPWLVLLAEPAFVGFRAFYSANVAPAIYLAALLAAIPGLRRNNWQWFYLVVVLAAFVKITLLVLLLLPLLAGMRQWLGSIASGVTVVAANLLQQRHFSTLYAGYKAALVEQVERQQQYGAGVFGFAAHIEHRLHGRVGIAAYGFHAAFVLLMLAILFQLKRRSGYGPGQQPAYEAEATRSLWLGVLIIAVIVANPRVLHYDMFIALFAAYAILGISLRLDKWKLVALAVVLQLPALLIVVGLRSYTVQTAWELIVVLAALALGILQLWHRLPMVRSVEEREAIAH